MNPILFVKDYKIMYKIIKAKLRKEKKVKRTHDL